MIVNILWTIIGATILTVIEALLGTAISRILEGDVFGYIVLFTANVLGLVVWGSYQTQPAIGPIRRMDTFLAPCMIEAGGFSSEVTFAIDTGYMTDRYIGLSDRAHVLNDEKKPFGNDELPPGAPVNGYVKCRWLRTEDGNKALVEIPGGEAIYIPADELEKV